MTDDASETPKITPNLLDCEPSALASYLLDNRFEGDAMATASFLLECTSTLPNAEAISAQLLVGEAEVTEETVEEDNEKKTVVETSSDLGNALTEKATVSMTTPRGKFTMTLHEQGIRFANAKNQFLLIPPQTVERIVMFPKPEDCRKVGKQDVYSGDMVLLCLQNDTNFNDKPLTQVCFQPPKGDSPTASSWLDLFCTCLRLNKKRQVAIVQNPKNPTDRSRYSFRSHDPGGTSSTTAGMPYVQCYHGVKDGALYPMEEGLLFFK